MVAVGHTAVALLEDGKAVYGIPGPGTYVAPSSFRYTLCQASDAAMILLNVWCVELHHVFAAAAAASWHVSLMLADRSSQPLHHGL